jgi:hypothetical protein
MENSDLFQKVKNLKLPKGKYALFGSAPMGIRKLRDCHDIDIIVVDDLWNEYRNKSGWEYKINERGGESLTNGDIEFWHDWLPWYQNVNELIYGAEMIDGLPFVQLKYVVEWKKAYGREKDFSDIKIIEEFLRTQE